jgi:hypothetical protein
MGLAHHISLKTKRRKFIDEYLFEKLHHESRPIVNGSVISLIRLYKQNPELAPYGSHHLRLSDFLFVTGNRDTKLIVNGKLINLIALFKPKPGAVPYYRVSASNDCLLNDEDSKVSESRPPVNTSLRKRISTFEELVPEEDIESNEMIPGDPTMRAAFCSKLDAVTSTALDKQMLVQQFYECRVASLERYIAFCVMFHAMASASNKPVFQYPWDVARSQSNLRVATTASPISAGDSHGVSITKATKEYSRKLGLKLTKTRTNF